MKPFFRNMTSRFLALLAAFALSFAQGAAQAQPAHSYSQQELDQMLAPIALYPDPLLSQILMAATYPMEVIEAARWSRDRPGLAGDDAVRAAEAEDWDPSVKSLLAFPQLLARMGENLQWTQSLGDAFLEQEPEVMDTVQELRRRAQAAGNLRSDARVSVIQNGPHLLLQPSDPQILYVPYYDPLVVYGSWWWPASPPMYLRPWPGHHARPTYAGGFYWGPPVGISLGFFFGAIDWRQRQVRVVPVHNYYYKPAGMRHAHAAPPPGMRRPSAWQHDPDHRRGVAYGRIEARQRIGPASVLPERGHQARAAEVQRFDRRTDAHVDRPSEGRRPETQSIMKLRPDVRPASVTRPAPLAHPAPTVQPAPTDVHFGQRREMRGPAQPVQPAPAVPGVGPASVMQTTPAARVAAPVPAVQAVPAARGDGHAARFEQRPRVEMQRPPQPRVEVRPAPGPVRQEPAPMPTVRQEPARHPAPQAGAPRAELRAAAAAAREDSGVKAFGRPRMGQ